MSEVDHLIARVAALELLVEQLIFERLQQTDSPEDAARLAMGRLVNLATQRPDVPAEAIGVIADVLAAVMMRLEHDDPPPMQWDDE